MHTLTLLFLIFAAIVLTAIGVAFYAVRNARRVNGVLWGVLNPPRRTPTDRVVLSLASTEASKDPTRLNQLVPFKIKPEQSMEISVRAKGRPFRPDRVIIAAAGTKHGSADWLVNDIKVANKSQFSQAGDIPGDMFDATAIDTFVSFATVQTSQDFTMVVTYIGENPDGAMFSAAVLGAAARETYDMPEMPPLSRKEKRLERRLAKQLTKRGLAFGSGNPPGFPPPSN